MNDWTRGHFSAARNRKFRKLIWNPKTDSGVWDKSAKTTVATIADSMGEHGYHKPKKTFLLCHGSDEPQLQGHIDNRKAYREKWKASVNYQKIEINKIKK